MSQSWLTERRNDPGPFLTGRVRGLPGCRQANLQLVERDELNYWAVGVWLRTMEGRGARSSSQVQVACCTA